MLVIIPHISFIQKLTQLQNELKKILPNNNLIFIPTFPLWLKIDCNSEDNKGNLKKLGDSIKKVQFNELFSKNQEIFLKAVVETNEKNFNSSVKLLTSINKSSKVENYPTDIFSQELQHNTLQDVELKIFRLGICNEDLNKKTIAVSDYVWKKIK